MLTAVLALWLVLWLTTVWVRPLWPVDETRYVSVAWEMWLRGDALIPHLNGRPYSQKPPLLFWLICLGWRVFGVNSLWPRLVPGLFTVASLILTARLARQLWPGETRPAELAPAILLGTVLWLFFATPVMFDMLLTCCVLTALSAFLAAWRSAAPGAWLAGSTALGLGLLAKGPVVLIYTVPAAALAPWWGRGTMAIPRARWYRALGWSLLLGGAIALCWVIPAALRGGEPYTETILWGQTADRLMEASAHRHPWWWYLPIVPLVLLPWSVWPALWRAAARSAAGGPGMRFCAACAIPGLVLLSLVSSKQVHYLVPLAPTFALAAGRSLETADLGDKDGWLPGLLLILLGVAVLVVRYAGPGLGLPGWTTRVSPLLAGMLVAGGTALARWLRGPLSTRVLALTAASVLGAVAMYLGGVAAAAPYYDVTPTAQLLAKLQREGHPLAYVGNYRGEFQFVGRLRRPLDVLDEVGDAATWLRAHPGGRVVMAVRDWSEVPDLKVEQAQPYRGAEMLAVLRAPP
jgi:4-amino-4-deoxy-L-arabinose transferase-like glycosyltransferase